MIIGEFGVEADNLEEAIKLARQKYIDGEFVLEPGEVVAKQMAILISDEEMEWIEF